MTTVSMYIAVLSRKPLVPFKRLRCALNRQKDSNRTGDGTRERSAACRHRKSPIGQVAAIVALLASLVIGRTHSQDTINLIAKSELAEEGNIRQIVGLRGERALLVNDSRIQLWSFRELGNPELLSSVENGRAFWELTYCPSRQLFVHANSTNNSGFFLYALHAAGEVERVHAFEFQPRIRDGRTLAFAFSNGGSLLACANFGERQDRPVGIKIWDTMNRKHVTVIPYQDDAQVVHFLGDRFLLVISMGGEGKVWDLAEEPARVTERFRVPLQPTLSRGFGDVHNDPNGKLTLVYRTPAVKLGLARIRESQLGVSEISSGDRFEVRHRAINMGKHHWFCAYKLWHDGRHIITGDADGNLRVFSVENENATQIFHRKLHDLRAIRSIEDVAEDAFAVGGVGNYLYVFGFMAD